MHTHIHKNIYACKYVSMYLYLHRVLPDSLFDDVGDIFQRRPVLLHFVVAQGDVVREIRLITQQIQGFGELVLRLDTRTDRQT